jgi:hypothetical protein
MSTFAFLASILQRCGCSLMLDSLIPLPALYQLVSIAPAGLHRQPLGLNSVPVFAAPTRRRQPGRPPPAEPPRWRRPQLHRLQRRTRQRLRPPQVRGAHVEAGVWSALTASPAPLSAPVCSFSTTCSCCLQSASHPSVDLTLVEATRVFVAPNRLQQSEASRRHIPINSSGVLRQQAKFTSPSQGPLKLLHGLQRSDRGAFDSAGGAASTPADSSTPAPTAAPTAAPAPQSAPRTVRLQ